ILVGGSTRTPRVSEMLEERLGQEPSQEVNPDLCVALGAAIQGAIVEGEDVGAVLVDITPHTLGIKALSSDPMAHNPYVFAKIIHRNTPLPASRSEVFYTVQDNQPRVMVEVFQGENEVVDQNVRVGAFTIE